MIKEKFMGAIIVVSLEEVETLILTLI